MNAVSPMPGAAPRFVLTGSSARKLRRGGIDLLAGRALHRTLHPFMAAELASFRLGLVPDPPPRLLVAYALRLTLLAGFSGLVYELTWEKVLATLLGSHSEATAAVLGLFLGGLALGYSLFGAITRRLVDRARAAGRPPRLLFFYGCVEGLIGIYALLFPSFFKLAQSVSFLIPHGGGGLSFALDVALSGLLIGPPAVLMGGTIPILTQALARSLADATRFHAFVYAFNTAGAFAGALAAGFWLVPALGLVGVLVAMGLVNLFAGATFVALGLRVSAASAPEARAQRARVRAELRRHDHDFAPARTDRGRL